jgi:RNA polymerase sigma-54 factor
MKQTIQLRLGQHLTMTPQLQQAIRLLQLSTLELQTEIQQALDSNLMLEAVDENTQTAPDTADYAAEAGERTGDELNTSFDDHYQSSDLGADKVNGNDLSADDADFSAQTTAETIPDELPTDSQWDDIFDGSTSYSAPDSDDQRDSFEAHTAEATSLQGHLEWQMELTPFSDTDRLIATAIIDAINEDGYLSTSLEELHQSLPPQLGVELDEVLAVLHRVQQFDPLGVAARDLKECVLIQLKALPKDTPRRSEAIKLATDYLDLLGSRQFSVIMRRMKLDETELQEIIDLIRAQNPKPGAHISAKQPEYVVPDVFVRKHHGQWTVELNPETAPRLRINPFYAGMVRRADNSSDNTYLKNHLQEARWFLKSLRSRNDTLLKVATCIVQRQHEFFEQGEEFMKPLVLREVAEIVEMHESTISRITTQKYMHTPRGIYEFKYFFSSHVNTTEGGEASSTAIRAIIKRLISAEPPPKPLSDSKLASLLKKEGIDVARRTVAKYREAMQIPSSSERKRLA